MYEVWRKRGSDTELVASFTSRDDAINYAQQFVKTDDFTFWEVRFNGEVIAEG